MSPQIFQTCSLRRILVIFVKILQLQTPGCMNSVNCHCEYIVMLILIINFKQCSVVIPEIICIDTGPEMFQNFKTFHLFKFRFASQQLVNYVDVYVTLHYK